MDEEKLTNQLWDAWDFWDEYAFWTDTTSFEIPTITHNIRPKTNQSKNTISKSACTIFGSWNQIIRLFWLDLSLDEANAIGLEIVEYCKKFWYVVWKWWATPTAINSVCKWWNNIWKDKFNKGTVFYVAASRDDSKVKEALEKWHLVGFTYALNWNEDRYVWLIDKDSYNVATWHRTNIKNSALTNATSWLKVSDANEWVHDSFYWYTNEYYIKDITKYINNWVYANFYLILPESSMDWTVEEEKKKIEETKAINSVIASLTVAYWSVPEEYQNKFADLAKELREKYEDAMPIIGNEVTKSATSIVNSLSFNYKFVPEKYQNKFAELAKELREDFNIN